ncbi:hypothetical protein HGRIS_005208 [Hohenbuehelia grisea]|uniref:F-box domain-containing protein n=1 Tax=Hohenbuehelia grisea TaxID=104357 RepID=A0ABR3JFS6_9AGAR
MHRCFFTAEISTMICAHLKYMESHASLAALAVTCKSLEGPALDALWYYQLGLVNLIQCLPEGVLSEKYSRVPFASAEHLELQWHQSTAYFLSSPVDPTDLRRFCTYAARIRSLRMGFVTVVPPRLNATREEVTVDPLTVRALASMLPHALLPNLKSLDWSSEAKFEPHDLPTFLSPSLSTLRYQVHNGSPIELSMLYRLQQLSLTHIRITFAADDFDEVDDSTAVNICRAVQSIRSLETLHLPFYKASALPHLAALLHLEELQIADHHQPPISLDGIHCSGFHALTKLNLFLTTFDVAIDLVNLLDQRPLVSLKISTLDALLASEWDNILSAISTHCIPTSLTELLICDSYGGISRLPPSAWALSTHAIRSLASLVNLQDVRLSGCRLRITDHTVLQLGAWPQLKVLCLAMNRLSGEGNIVSQYGVTFAGLRHLAKKCPALQSLTIELDSSVADAAQGMHPRCGISHGHLKTLDIRYTPPSPNDPAIVAMALSDIFSSLQCVIRSLSRISDEGRHGWDKVSEYVPWFGAIRLEERSSTEELCAIDIV